MTSNATAPRLSEADFQRQVTELAELRGWVYAHFRPAITSKGWRVPVSGPLGQGWPDLVLIRERDRRLLFVELKAEKAKLTLAQTGVLRVLSSLAGDWVADPDGAIGISVWVWHPSDWVTIERVLR